MVRKLYLILEVILALRKGQVGIIGVRSCMICENDSSNKRL